MKNHKIVHKLQLKNKLESYHFFRLSPHENRSLVFYRLKCSEGEVASRSSGIQRRSPQPPLFHKEYVYQDLKSSQHRLKQKSSKKKRPGYRSPTNSLEQIIPLWNRSVNIQALGLGLDWFEISVFRFLSDKKANSYKTEFQFQVILPNREGFLDLGDIHYS